MVPTSHYSINFEPQFFLHIQNSYQTLNIRNIIKIVPTWFNLRIPSSLNFSSYFEIYILQIYIPIPYKSD